MTANLEREDALRLAGVAPGRLERQLAATVAVSSLLVFAMLAPFAAAPLPPSWAFIPLYEAWMVVAGLVTATLLLGQYLSYGSRALLVLACGYLFSSLVAIVHAFTFPGRFESAALAAAGPQATAWLCVFGHAGFPLFVIGYAILKRDGRHPTTHRPLAAPGLWLPLVATAILVAACGALATRGQDLLPTIVIGDHYTPAMGWAVAVVWASCFGALLALWRRPRSALDHWLMVVMWAWLLDVALSAMLNEGRFDLGFYAGRIYGLFASSVVAVMLLAEGGVLEETRRRLVSLLQGLSSRDALTGLANRAAFQRALARELQRAARSGAPVALLRIDVDHFRTYADRYGQAAGEACLRAVAGVVRVGASRAGDLAARYAEESFVVILRGSDAVAARAVAERILFAHHGSRGGFVTFSIGGAAVRRVEPALPPGPRDVGPDAFVALANRALADARSAGRDRAVVLPDFTT